MRDWLVAGAHDHDPDPLRLVTHDPERARHMVMLEFGSRDDFNDPGPVPYRRLFGRASSARSCSSLVAPAAATLHAEGQISLSAAVVSARV